MQPKVTRRNITIPAILSVLLLAPGSIAAAQDPAGPFERLVTVLKPGDTVVITDLNGRRTSGKLRELSASAVEARPSSLYPP